MSDNDSQPAGERLHPSVRTEPSDASFRWILGLILGSLAFAVVVFSLIMVFFVQERAALDAQSRSRFPLAATPPRGLPAEPRLEPLDRLEAVTSSNVYLREKAKLDRLDSYGTTEEKDFLHIPIDRAMQILAGKLPARGEGPREWRSNGLVDGGASNSGRMFNRRDPRWYGR